MSHGLNGWGVARRWLMITLARLPIISNTNLLTLTIHALARLAVRGVRRRVAGIHAVVVVRQRLLGNAARRGRGILRRLVADGR
jgi:hypothetical protein